MCIHIVLWENPPKLPTKSTRAFQTRCFSCDSFKQRHSSLNDNAHGISQIFRRRLFSLVTVWHWSTMLTWELQEVAEIELVLTSEIPTVEIPRALEGILGMKMSLPISASVRLNQLKQSRAGHCLGLMRKRKIKKWNHLSGKHKKYICLIILFSSSYFEKSSVFFLPQDTKILKMSSWHVTLPTHWLLVKYLYDELEVY